MKTNKFWILLLASLILAGAGSFTQAQEVKEREKVSSKMEAEEKARQEEMKAEQELRKALEQSKKIQHEEFQRLNEEQAKMRQQVYETYQKSMEQFQDQKFRRGVTVIPEVRIEGLDRDMFRGFRDQSWVIMPSDANAMEISKDLDNLDFQNDFKYELGTGSRSISFSVNGELSQGELVITLVKPNGKTLQKIEISPLANINWNQSLQWDEKDADQFTGTWTISIKADDATGRYRASVRNR